MAKFFVSLLLCFSAFAASLQYDTFMTMQERAQGIPEKLLRAVSNIESGRSANGTFAPWPWTINVEGRGYRYKTKQEAIKAVEKFQRQGVKSIDVGLMQINLRHHPSAFRNLEEAFDPQLNVAYGAKFLKQLFQQNKSWHLAIGHYHSATPKFHKAYQQRVLKNWRQIANKPTGNQAGVQLAKTVWQFDDLKDLENAPNKSQATEPQQASPKASSQASFAKIKKVYYPLNGSGSNHSLNSAKTSYVLENAASREYYCLD